MLAVSEYFYSVQGEGQTCGVPAVFIRLGGCNLLCGGKDTIKDGKLHDSATWRCDSLQVWRKSKKYKPEDFVKLLIKEGYIEKLDEGAHLVVTGGEPFLQKEELYTFFEELVWNCDRAPYVEMETNGTLWEPTMLEYVHLFNVSPKLKNSGVPREKRIVQNVLQSFSERSETCWKFVVENLSDVEEAQNEFIRPLSLRPQQIWLMPAAESREEYRSKIEDVVELAKDTGYRFSPRLQIEVWDKATGV